MNTNQGKRLIACVLVIILICGIMTVSSAEPATLGVYLSGVRTAKDGTKTTVRLDGKFRVLQNGREAGIIDAGKTTVTLPEAERVRIIPLPESISAEWDLSTAYCEVIPEAGGTMTVPVIVYPLADKPEPTEEPSSTDLKESGTETAEDGTETSDEGELLFETPVPDEETEENQEPVSVIEAGPTPTLPPVDPALLQPTPEPNLSSLHVSGQCWFDETADGLFKDGEPTLAGIKIEMDGVKNGLHYETVSGADGKWCIDEIEPAFYNLTVTAPDGMMFAKVSKRGGRRSIITKDGTNRASRQMDLNDRESKDKQYIGFTWAGEITGRCFLDANYNGMYDEGEEPMPGVKITAIKPAMDEEVAKTFSAEDGTYTLTGLRGNNYKMRAVLPEDGSDFSKTVSDPLGNHFQSRPSRRENFWNNFVLNEGQSREMNVGVIYPGSITGTVYYDDDFSADKSGGEKVVSGFLVGLYDENGNVVAMDKTSVKGKYELTKLVPGNYTLHVTATKGYAFTKLGDGNVIVNRTGGEGFSEPFFLALGENKTDMDVGMIQPGVIRGTVFADRNDNGVRDEGENGLPGVTVRLMSEEGEEAFKAEIGEDGAYLFDAVMPGSYYLEYTLPENAVFARTGTGGNTISGESGVGKSEPFDFKSGSELQGPACGALTLGRVDGLAYHDHDGDGLRGEGEEELAGMTLTLTPSRAELEEITVTTEEDGSFALEALRPDNWTLTVTCPEENVLSRTDHIALPLTAGKDTQSISMNVAMGAQWNDQQLGAVIPASLSGQVWMDENNNGFFDDGESTPEGLEITVTDDLTGKVFDTLRTDEEGRYETSGMIPGNFTVSFPLDERTIAPKDGDSVFEEAGGRLVVSGIALKEDEAREGLLLGIVRPAARHCPLYIDRRRRMDRPRGHGGTAGRRGSPPAG